MDLTVSFFTPVYIKNIKPQSEEYLPWQMNVINFAEYLLDSGIGNTFSIDAKNLALNGTKIVDLHRDTNNASFSCGFWRPVQFVAFTILFPIGLAALVVKAYHHWDGFDFEPPITEYRPDYSVITDGEDRLRPTYLPNTSYFSRTKTPIELIQKYTSPNKFFALCENQFEDFMLHHASAAEDGWGNDDSGMNAFTRAADLGNKDLLTGLLETAPELVNLGDAIGLTPLMWACMHEDKEIAVEIAELLIENGAQVNLSTCLGNGHYGKHISQFSTALHIATLYKNDALIELLLKNNATLDHPLFENKEDELRAKLKGDILYENPFYPTPEMNPSAYNLTKKQVKYLFNMSKNVTWERCMPLVEWNKRNSDITVPNDIVRFIVEIYKNMSLFWR